jgi:hypothetical protein
MERHTRTPAHKAVEAATQRLHDTAADCLNLTPHADPTKMPVTHDYASALHELRIAANSGNPTRLATATRRFSRSLQVAGGPAPIFLAGGGEPELRLTGAILNLRDAIRARDHAIAELVSNTDAT